MNDPRVLQIYGQLFHFRETIAAHELLINEPDRLQQVTLCAIAHSLDLQYEYYLSSRRARITRFSQLDRTAGDTSMRHAHLAAELPAMSYLSDGSYHGGIQTQYPPDLCFSVDSNCLLRSTQMFPITNTFTHTSNTSMESQISSVCDFQNGFSNLQHLQHAQRNTSLHQFNTSHASNDDKEIRDLLYQNQASVAAIAPWYHAGSTASSKMSTPSVCSGTSSHRSTPSFRKRIFVGSTSKSPRSCQYCGELFKRPSFQGIHECLCTSEMRG